jgi:hypothetical protein
MKLTRRQLNEIIRRSLTVEAAGGSSISVDNIGSAFKVAGAGAGTNPSLTGGTGQQIDKAVSSASAKALKSSLSPEATDA